MQYIQETASIIAFQFDTKKLKVTFSNVSVKFINKKPLQIHYGISLKDFN